MRIVDAPIEESNLWISPLREHPSSEPSVPLRLAAKSPSTMPSAGLSRYTSPVAGLTSTSVNWLAPFVSMNERGRSTIVLPFQIIFMEGSSVTSATTVASRFSFSAAAMNLSRSAGCTTTAILSCDSEIAISVPSRPSYFLGTASRLILKPSASSPIATDTPPAPKSLHLMMSLVTSGYLKSLWSFLSVGGLPFWTSEPHVITDFVS